MDYIDVATKYAKDVNDGTINSCEYVKLAGQRFMRDMIDPLYYYNEVEATNVIEFLQSFFLTETTPKRLLILEPWQVFIVVNIYGLYKVETKTKKYRLAYLELSRGNGKTQLISLLSIYELLMGDDAQVVLAANTTKQVMEVDFDKIKKLVYQIDPDQKHIRVYYNRIVFGNNKLILSSNEARPIDGLSGSFMVIDEMHEMESLNVYNVLKSSMVKRTDNILFVITTAGFNNESECYKMRSYCIQVLKQKFNDPSQFGMVFTIDEGDDYTDPSNWVKATPNIGVSVVEEAIQSEVNKAQQSDLEKNGVLVKHFNVWLKNSQIEDWIDEEYITKAMQEIDMTEARFEGLDVWSGVDLSTVSDITAVSHLLQLDDMYYFFSDLYLPEETIKKSPNKDIYQQAVENNEINVTLGNVIDYQYILNDLVKTRDHKNIIQINYDKWNSTSWAIDATEAGFYLQPFSQVAGNLNRPLKEFEKLIKEGRLVIQKNSLTQWMLGNVRLKINHMGNYSIDKSDRNKKIDNVASMINALGGFLDSPQYSGNVW